MDKKEMIQIQKEAYNSLSSQYDYVEAGLIKERVKVIELEAKVEKLEGRLQGAQEAQILLQDENKKLRELIDKIFIIAKESTFINANIIYDMIIERRKSDGRG